MLQKRFSQRGRLFACFLAWALAQASTVVAQDGSGLRSDVLQAREWFRGGPYVDSERLYKRALDAANSKAVYSLAGTLVSLAELYEWQGRYAESEQLLVRVLAAEEAKSGATPYTLSVLAGLYESQGRYDEAERIYKRALALQEKLTADGSAAAIIRNNLAVLYTYQGNYAEAERLNKRAHEFFNNHYGADDEVTIHNVNDLARLYKAQGRFAEAEPLYLHTVQKREVLLGHEHALTAKSLYELATLYGAQGRYGEAEQLHKRALAIRERVQAADHPEVAETLWNLAILSSEQGAHQAALSLQRRATGIRIKRSLLGGERGDGRKREVAQGAKHFRFHVLAASRADMIGAISLSESFEMAQWAVQSEAADALAQMSARFATGKSALAQAVRHRQDLVRRRQAADMRLSGNIGSTDARTVEATRQEIARVEDMLNTIDQQLAREFPDFVQFARPRPLDIVATQASLGGKEVLFVVLDVHRYGRLPEETFVWAITKTAARWFRLSLTPTEIAASVAALRCGLDDTLWNDGDSSERCIRALKAQRYDGVGFVGALPFDLERAHELYKALFGPIEDLIKDKHLLVVPSGPLTSLPFNALVTGPPKTRIPDNPAEYRGVAWLGTRQPITVLPSVGSLKALRAHAKISRATKAYLGVGNPLLNGPPHEDYSKQAETARQWKRCAVVPAQWAVVASTRGRRSSPGFKSLFRGTQADIEYVRQQTPLPETADELCRIARGLGVPESDVLLGTRATETTVKGLSEKGRLADYRVVHFATHGALAGELKGLSEPGLILTPPAGGSGDAKLLERDDGYLTASEIATLKLDADWVILSACNTAGAAGETAEALSGLARAFFYAGTRTLLVSHWAVDSDAAVKLTTRAFDELKANPTIGRAEAFRVSMRDLIHNGSAINAHPMQWAPFVVVGGGALSR